MKRLAVVLSMTLLLYLTSASAQSSPQGASSSPSVDKNQVIARLLLEVDEARAYITELETREAALVRETNAADAAYATLTEAHKAALIELGELRATIRFQKVALEERETQVKNLHAQNDRVTQERDEALRQNKSLKRENRLFKAVTVIRLAVDVIRAVS